MVTRPRLRASVRKRCAAARRLFHRNTQRPRGCPCSRELMTERSIRYGDSQGAGEELALFLPQVPEKGGFREPGEKTAHLAVCALRGPTPGATRGRPSPPPGATP